MCLLIVHISYRVNNGKPMTYIINPTKPNTDAI